MFNNIYKNKKVLITGHTGFKGSWLTSWLLNLGAEVAGYSVDIPTNPSHFDELNIEKKINHNIGDVRDFNSLSKVLRKVRYKEKFEYPSIRIKANANTKISKLHKIHGILLHY